MTKIKIDSASSYPISAQKFAEQRGLDTLPQSTLKALANDKGVVDIDTLQTLAKAAKLDTDGVVSPAESKRIDGYVKDRQPVVASVGGSSAVDVRVTRRKAVAEYFTFDAALKGKDVVIQLEIDPAGNAPKSRQVQLKGFTFKSDDELSAAISTQRYTATGANASVGSVRGGVGAGTMIGIADPKKGAVLVNISNAGAINKDLPDTRTLFSPAELAKQPAVKELAKSLGLDVKNLTVAVTGVSFHSDFSVEGGGAHTELHTLLLDIEVKSPGKKKHQAQLSAFVEGNPTKALSKLVVDDLEVGANFSYGFVYPKSFGLEKPAPQPGTRTVDDGPRGGGEGSPSVPSPRRGGGEGSPSIPSPRRGGGEGSPSVPSPRRGGGE